MKEFFRNRGVLACLVFFIAASSLFFTLGDPGVTQDEPYVNLRAGKSYIAFLGVVGHDLVKGDWGHFTSQEVIDEYFKRKYTFHPPFGRLLPGITWKLFHERLGEMRSLRLAPALLFSLSVALLFLLVSRHYGNLPGLVSALAYLLCPATFGHAHLIALDSPIASMWVITTYCFVRGLESRRWALVFAVAAGLAMNTKIHGFALPAPLFIWGALAFRKKVLSNLYAFLWLCPLTLFLTNPTYWNNLHYVVSFIDDMTSKKEYERVGTYFMGDRYDFTPPKYYAFMMAGITIPPLTLLLSLAGLVAGVFRDVRGLIRRDGGFPLCSLFFANALTGLCLTLFNSIPIYDGVRLFLTAYPFLTGLAGPGLYYLGRGISAQRAKRVLVPGVAAAAVLASLVSLWRIHPFELSYYNGFIGGLRGATKIGLETTYWNDVFTLDFAKMLNEKYAGKTFSRVTGLRYTFRYYEEAGILDPSISQKKEDYDYFLLMYRQGWFHEAQWFYAGYMTPEYAVEREGVPLLEIYKAAVPQGEPGSGPRPDLPGQWLTPQGLEWARYLIAPRDGLYRLVIWTPVNHRLELDDRPLERNEPEKAHDLWEYEITLQKGPHPFKLLFYRAGKLPRFYLGWITPGGTKGSIPSEKLIPMDAPSSLPKQSFLEDPADHP